MREKAENKPLMPSMLLSWLKIEAEERDWENRGGQKRWGMEETTDLTDRQSRWGGIYQVTLTVSGFERVAARVTQRHLHDASTLIPDGQTLPRLIMCMTMMSMFGCMLLAWLVSTQAHTHTLTLINAGLFQPDKTWHTPWMTLNTYFKNRKETQIKANWD